MTNDELALTQNIDLPEIIDLCNRFLQNKITVQEIVSEYGPLCADYAKSYVSSCGFELIESKIHSFIDSSKDETLRSLNEDGFSELLADTALNVGALVKKYFDKEISILELLSMLGETGVRDISSTLISAYDIDVDGIREMAYEISKENSLIISYAAFSEAYKVLMSALNDATIQHEHRIKIEKECEKTISMIKEYRKKMQDSITRYFEKNLSTFEHGFAMMDKAIQDNDSDGYIKGNTEIQEALGYYSQFRNQKEFDDLMDSDEAFKL